MEFINRAKLENEICELGVIYSLNNQSREATVINQVLALIDSLPIVDYDLRLPIGAKVKFEADDKELDGTVIGRKLSFYLIGVDDPDFVGHDADLYDEKLLESDEHYRQEHKCWWVEEDFIKGA